MQDWLAASTIANPEKIALISDRHEVNFRTYKMTVEGIATAFANSQYFLRQSERLAVLQNSSVESVCNLLALLRLGLTLVPLNTRLNPQEIIQQIKNVESKYLLLDDAFFSQLEGNAVLENTVLVPTNQLKVRGDMQALSYLEDISENKAAAIIHTSGTSGRPKGAVLTYGNFFYSAMASAYRIGHLPDDKWLCVLPLYHVGGLSIILRAVLNGTTVDLRPKFDVDEVNHALSHEDISLVSLVPTMLYRLLEKGSPEKWKKLRLILLGGAAASIELLEECRARKLPVATTYGLTEACSQVATALPHELYAKMGTVGKPLMFTQIKIVDEEGKRQKAGDYGEILVKGPTVMQGYYNDPAATAKALRDGWLYTGDIGYMDRDGDLFLVQRRSDLIVSGGENVYPAEIEAVLRRHPAVKEAVVVGLDDAEWGQKVVTAIQLREGQNVNEAEILAHARNHLAGYKIPRLIKFVSEFPMTGSGKIQRGAVKDLFEKS